MPNGVFHRRERMLRLYKRLLLIGVMLLGIATGVVVASGGRLAGVIARQAIARATKLAAARGIDLHDVRFDRASFAGFGAIRCDQLSGTAGIAGLGELSARHATATFAATTVMVDAGWPWSGQASLAVIDGRIDVIDSSGAATGEQLTRVRLQTSIPFSWSSPGVTAGVIETEARRLIREGWTRLPLEFTAYAGFTVARRLQKLSVRTEPITGGGSRVALDPAEIEQLSREYTNPLTTTEIKLVARYPHRAPALLRACERAARAARAQRHRDRTFPHDAYRHVYWSWLLTKEFGPEFSEEVTDAHEIGATYEVGSAARRMDLQNNAVGRAYALAGVEEGELVDRVLTDPNVMRKAATAAATPR